MRICFKTGLALGIVGAALHASSPPPRKVTLVVRPDARSGKLVRSAVVTSRVVAPSVVEPRKVDEAAEERKAPPPPPPSTFREAIENVAYRHALPVQLLHSVIRVESNYNPWAVSPKGAQGLMQLIPATARRFGVSNAFDPMQNLEGGARYLRYLLDLYKGDPKLALAAYNAGEGAVARYGGVPPYAETWNYLIQIRRRLEESRPDPPKAQAAGPARSTVEVKPVAVRNRIEEIVDADGRVRYVSR
jgi:hypothetical protein